MSDLVIRQADGWTEITPMVVDAINLGRVNMNEIWTMMGQGRTEDVEAQLRMSETINDYFGQKMPTAFHLVMVPDSMRGELVRVWVMLRRVKRS